MQKSFNKANFYWYCRKIFLREVKTNDSRFKIIAAKDRAHFCANQKSACAVDLDRVMEYLSFRKLAHLGILLDADIGNGDWGNECDHHDAQDHQRNLERRQHHHRSFTFSLFSLFFSFYFNNLKQIVPLTC